MNRVEHVVAQLHGEESLEAYAARAGVGVDELREWKALYLAGGAAAFAPKRSNPWLIAAVAAFALIPASVYAVGTCSQTLPYPLVTFCPDQPAVAAEMNGNFAALAKAIVDRTGALDGGSNITQSNTGRLLSSDNVVRVGGNAATVQLQLDTNSGGSGAGLYVDGTDTLFVNRGNYFIGGTTIDGSAKVNSNLTVNGNVVTSSVQPVGGQMSIGSSTNLTNLAVWGELQANTIRARNCSWRSGPQVQRDTDTGAGCNPGEYAAGISCRVPTNFYLQCAVYCCSP